MKSGKPIKQVKIGSIIGSIWRNKGGNGDWYTVTLKRAYRSEHGWQFTESLGCNDLLVAAKVLDQAHTRIIKMQERGQNEERVLKGIRGEAAAPDATQLTSKPK